MIETDQDGSWNTGRPFDEIKEGTKLTIDGFGEAKDGTVIWCGKSVKTGRKRKIHKLTVFTAGRTDKNGDLSLGQQGDYYTKDQFIKAFEGEC